MIGLGFAALVLGGGFAPSDASAEDRLLLCRGEECTWVDGDLSLYRCEEDAERLGPDGELEVDPDACIRLDPEDEYAPDPGRRDTERRYLRDTGLLIIHGHGLALERRVHDRHFRKRIHREHRKARRVQRNGPSRHDRARVHAPHVTRILVGCPRNGRVPWMRFIGFAYVYF